MKLSQLAAKPQLIKMELDDPDTLAEFSEPLEFWTWDRQPLDIFMQLAVSQQQDPTQMLEIVRKLLLDDTGKPILQDGVMLPTSVLIRAIARLTDELGK